VPELNLSGKAGSRTRVAFPERFNSGTALFVKRSLVRAAMDRRIGE
jgi:hypothetical protein